MHFSRFVAPLTLLVGLGLGWAVGPRIPATRASGQALDEGRREPILEGLGPYKREVTTASEDAQRYFNQGLNLLFAFNHDEACRSFRQAAAIDPDLRHGLVGGGHLPGAAHQPPDCRCRAGPRRLGGHRQGPRRDRPGQATWSAGSSTALAKRCVPDPPEDRSALDRAYADAMRALRADHPGRRRHRRPSPPRR